MNVVLEDTLLPAWADNVQDAQTTFRSVLKALSEPGLVQTLRADVKGPMPFDVAMTALCLTLIDHETPVWLDARADLPAVQSYLRFHCGCPLVNDQLGASFALITDLHSGLSLDKFAQGSMEYPDRSATLLVQVPTLEDGPKRRISGPGIPATRHLTIGGLPTDFDEQWHANMNSFPLGVDIVFCCGDKIVGMPRTTQLHV